MPADVTSESLVETEASKLPTPSAESNGALRLGRPARDSRPTSRQEQTMPLGPQRLTPGFLTVSFPYRSGGCSCCWSLDCVASDGLSTPHAHKLATTTSRRSSGLPCSKLARRLFGLFRSRLPPWCVSPSIRQSVDPSLRLTRGCRRFAPGGYLQARVARSRGGQLHVGSVLVGSAAGRLTGWPAD